MAGVDGARRRPSFVPSLRVYGTIFAVLATILVATHPGLVVAGVVLVPAAVFTLAGARPGPRREIGDTLAQLIHAIVLAPSAAYVSGAFDPRTPARARWSPPPTSSAPSSSSGR